MLELAKGDKSWRTALNLADERKMEQKLYI